MTLTGEKTRLKSFALLVKDKQLISAFDGECHQQVRGLGSAVDRRSETRHHSVSTMKSNINQRLDVTSSGRDDDTIPDTFSLSISLSTKFSRTPSGPQPCRPHFTLLNPLKWRRQQQKYQRCEWFHNNEWTISVAPE
ncbi:hypothetical protein F2P81_021420 [Scophthalmus maximus]|uniref:Uncharacterized protein n=1 Tax=Scophthalmus maximus TaxID=52904 RepID=A0A6A4RX46_SCOMX|nr:hypothetical protein F2P81_021420 [Scophthalmus maximus]